MKSKAQSNGKDTGWTVQPNLYHFQHIPLSNAQKRSTVADGFHVVETINWTYANGDLSQVHLNKYVAMNLAEAVGLASTLALCFFAGEVAESVVAVRAATEKEVSEMRAAYDTLAKESPVLYD